MKKIRFITALILTIFIIATISLVGGVEAKDDELRGMWVSTVYNIDFPSKPGLSAANQKKELDKILADAKTMGLNAIFFQVRPTGDALYKSNIFPWSAYLTGEQGKENASGFDPLEYMVDICHKNNMELHAWINPLRITTGSAANPNIDISLLAQNNPARLNPEIVVAHNGQLYLDPGHPETIDLITKGVAEIVQNYDVDGIHFDDYFYPTKVTTKDANGKSITIDFDDSKSYAKYKGNFKTIGDFRRNNIDTLVKSVQTKVDSIRKEVEFGISPFAVWANIAQNPKGSNTKAGLSTYYDHYADTKKWVEENYIDYISPQIYWNIGYGPADFQILLNWWSDVAKNTKTKLYIGHAAYKVGDGSQSDAWIKGDEIAKQLNLTRDKGVAGNIFYGYSNLKANTLGVADYLKSYYLKAEAGETVSGEIEVDSIIPTGNVIKTEGEYVTFSCNAPSSATEVIVFMGPYRINLVRDVISGGTFASSYSTYTASFKLPQINIRKESISYGKPIFVMKNGGEYSSVIPNFTVTVKKNSLVAIVSQEEAPTRLGPSTTYDRGTPLVKGATDEIASEDGNFYKLKSGIFVPKTSVKVERKTLATNYISDIEVKESERYLDIFFKMPVNAPYTVTKTGNKVQLAIFSTTGREVIKLAGNSLINNFTYKKISNKVITYDFILKDSEKYYGYNVEYKNGGMVFSLKLPPQYGTSDKPLKNVKIILDAGHGGEDPGALSLITGTPHEKDINLAIVQKTKVELEKLGAQVLLSRAKDVKMELEDRQSVLRNEKSDLAISIHVNSLPRTGNYQSINGIMTLYSTEHGKNMSEFYQKELVAQLGRTDKESKYQSLAVCRVSQIPSILIETGFITNADDYTFLVSVEGQNSYAKAIASTTQKWVKAQN